LGVTGDLRVRHHGSNARIEVVPDQLPRVRGAWEDLVPVFIGLGFSAVDLDPQGYRRGSLLAVASPSGA
jgi:uncharacterized protein